MFLELSISVSAWKESLCIWCKLVTEVNHIRAAMNSYPSTRTKESRLPALDPSFSLNCQLRPLLVTGTVDPWKNQPRTH